MADHCEAGNTVFASNFRYNVDESPIHLETFTWPGCITTPPVPLRSNKQSFCRNQVQVAANVPFDSSSASCISQLRDSVEQDGGIPAAATEQVIQSICKFCKDSSGGFLSEMSMRFYDKIVLFQSTEFSAAQAGSPFQLCKVDFFEREVFSLYLLHLCKGLCYNLL